jgi:hypothetical protein
MFGAFMIFDLYRLPGKYRDPVRLLRSCDSERPSEGSAHARSGM